MADQVGKNGTMRGTSQFRRKGQTAGAFGNDPSVKASGAVTAERELKP